MKTETILVTFITHEYVGCLVWLMSHKLTWLEKRVNEASKLSERNWDFFFLYFYTFYKLLFWIKRGFYMQDVKTVKAGAILM